MCRVTKDEFENTIHYLLTLPVKEITWKRLFYLLSSCFLYGTAFLMINFTLFSIPILRKLLHVASQSLSWHSYENYSEKGKSTVLASFSVSIASKRYARQSSMLEPLYLNHIWTYYEKVEACRRRRESSVCRHSTLDTQRGRVERFTYYSKCHKRAAFLFQNDP